MPAPSLCTMDGNSPFATVTDNAATVTSPIYCDQSLSTLSKVTGLSLVTVRICLVTLRPVTGFML